MSEDCVKATRRELITNDLILRIEYESSRSTYSDIRGTSSNYWGESSCVPFAVWRDTGCFLPPDRGMELQNQVQPKSHPLDPQLSGSRGHCYRPQNRCAVTVKRLVTSGSKAPVDPLSLRSNLLIPPPPVGLSSQNPFPEKPSPSASAIVEKGVEEWLVISEGRARQRDLSPLKPPEQTHSLYQL